MLLRVQCLCRTSSYQHFLGTGGFLFLFFHTVCFLPASKNSVTVLYFLSVSISRSSHKCVLLKEVVTTLYMT